VTAQKEQIQFQFNEFILFQIISFVELSAGIEKKKVHTVYTGSLIKSYIQSHLTPMWIPLIEAKTITKLYGC